MRLKAPPSITTHYSLFTIHKVPVLVPENDIHLNKSHPHRNDTNRNEARSKKLAELVDGRVPDSIDLGRNLVNVIGSGDFALVRVHGA
jgi:hypothetical protein